MSRSRRKTPIHGMTTARSEKKDKRLYNRRFRHVSKQALHVSPQQEPLPHLREHSNPWSMDKDGKVRFDPKKHPEWMRK
ncbi:MAG TPA: hypothetical protein VN687_00210 [Blastocatellia bacterium]|nr:hypothetical protein [Blastocatellia bacterium]